MLNNFSVTKATGRLTLNKGVLKLNDFVGEHAKGVISGEAELNIPQGAGLSGRADVKGVVTQMSFSTLRRFRSKV